MNNEELRKIIELLEAQGREPKLIYRDVPVVNAKVACGRPTELGDTCVDYFREWPDEIINTMTAVAVRVTGDSMVDAGFVEGDEVAVELGRSVEEGDIVAVILDGESTIKGYMCDEDGHPWLIPQNESYSAIPITDMSNMKIVGVVTGLYRRKEKLRSSNMLGYLMKAKGPGRPRRKEFKDIMTKKYLRDHLKRLHTVLEGRKGKDVAFILQAARRLGWLMERPMFESVEAEFGSIGAKSNFNKYNRLQMTREEAVDYVALLGG